MRPIKEVCGIPDIRRYPRNTRFDEEIYEMRDILSRGTTRRHDGSAWAARFVGLGKKVKSCCLCMIWGQEVLSMSINKSSYEQNNATCLFPWSFHRRVRWKFAVVRDIVQLSHSFLDKILFAEYHNCRPLISRFNYNILPLTKRS